MILVIDDARGEVVVVIQREVIVVRVVWIVRVIELLIEPEIVAVALL